MKYYLYNKYANNGIKPECLNDVEIIDAVGLDYQKFFDELNPEDEVVFVGGDGTINYFVNNVDTDNLKNNVYYIGAGTGNDFLNDINVKPGVEILLNDYLKKLPTVDVNGIHKKFINGIGYGIDGYCCEVADKIKEKEPNKKIDYTGIAIKGLLFHYKTKTAKITVDGVTYEYKNAWLAPSMIGKYYGGGMDIAPNQDRMGDTLSVVVYKTRSKLKALINFPSIFKGEHIKKEKLVAIHTGKVITVEYNKPCALQIDGDTVLNVSTYTAKIDR